MLRRTCLPFLWKIKGSCFIIMGGLRGGREHRGEGAQVLEEKSTSWWEGCILPGTVYLWTQTIGFILTWPVDVWIIHWDSHCKSVERKQAFSQWFTGSSLRKNPYIPTSFYWWWRQPAQTKASGWDSFCLTYFRFTAKPRLLITIAVTHFLLNWVCLIADCIQNPTKLHYCFTHGCRPVW